MSYYINPNAILDNSIKQSSLPVKVQEKVDLYHINKQKPPIVGRVISVNSEEGSKYYFAKHEILVKNKNSKTGKTTGFVRLDIPDVSNRMFIIPKKDTPLYRSLIEVLTKIYEITTHTYSPTNEELSILEQCIQPITNGNFSYIETRSPYVKIINGTVVYDKKIHLLNPNNYLQYNYSDSDAPLSFRDLVFDSKVKIYKYRRDNTPSKQLEKICKWSHKSFREHRITTKTRTYKWKYKYRKFQVSSSVFSPTQPGFYKICPIYKGKIIKNNPLYIQYFRGTFHGIGVYDAFYLNKKPKYTIKYIR